MTLEQTLEELWKLGIVTMGSSKDDSEKWFVGLAMSGFMDWLSSDWHSTPLAAAQQCLERAKNAHA